MDDKEFGKLYDKTDPFRIAPKRQMTGAEHEAIDQVKKAAVSLLDVICEVVPESRERSMAITHLEDAVTRAVRGITE